jgi:hypothetical protein
MSLPGPGQQAGGMNATTGNPAASKPARSHPLSRPVEDWMLAGVAAGGRGAADRRFPKNEIASNVVSARLLAEKR